MAIHILNITKSGTGSGTVTSDVGVPAINCGDTCSDAQTSGTNVTLTATPARGSVFVGWTGAINSTQNPVTYLQEQNPTNINAEFRKRRSSSGIGSFPPFVYFAVDMNFLPEVPITNPTPDPKNPQVQKDVWFCSDAYFDGSRWCVSCSNGISNFTVCAGSSAAAKNNAHNQVQSAQGIVSGQTRAIITPQMTVRGILYNFDTVIEHKGRKYYQYKVAARGKKGSVLIY